MSSSSENRQTRIPESVKPSSESEKNIRPKPAIRSRVKVEKAPSKNYVKPPKSENRDKTRTDKEKSTIGEKKHQTKTTDKKSYEHRDKPRNDNVKGSETRKSTEINTPNDKNRDNNWGT